MQKILNKNNNFQGNRYFSMLKFIGSFHLLYKAIKHSAVHAQVKV
jgi:hypothetical protein